MPPPATMIDGFDLIAMTSPPELRPAMGLAIF
jgi:hypothetical protein